MRSSLRMFTIALVLAVSAGPISGQPLSVHRLIPKPSSIDLQEGVFRLMRNTAITADRELFVQGEQLKAFLSPATGFPLPVNTKKAGENLIRLRMMKGRSTLGEEGYRLAVTRDSILVAAATPRGIFWGIQTLRQLLPAEILRAARVDNVEWAIPCVSIVDTPRFRWRGLMIDYSRTFWDRRVTMKYIDLLSYYKMNRLHMHLTDDQGWRLEIAKYPLLTEKASRFDTAYHEPPEREGYYTKEDIRELVRYAEERNVELIPEIEMPGHSLAVLAAYPELSCTADKVTIHPFLQGPGVHEEVLCPGKRKTFEFLQDVLSEVIDLFPSAYVHIGGDEVPKVRWRACPDCRRTIRENGLKDEAELQSWFTREIEKYLNAKGRRLIGWDEITEGGLSRTATVMFWRGSGDGIATPVSDVLLAAVRQGNDVVQSPTSHCYFDYSYETTPTAKVYSFEPVPAELERIGPERILGVQANFWSHIDRTEPRMDRQIFPRLLALAEVGWTDRQNRGWSDFSARLMQNERSLRLLNVAD